MADNSELSFTLNGFGANLNGDYTLDLSTLTNYDYHVIKDVSGIVAGGLGDAMAEGDQEVMVAFVAICLIKRGLANLQQLAKKPNGILWLAQPGQIIWNVEVDDEVDDPDAPLELSGDGAKKPSSTSPSKATSDVA